MTLVATLSEMRHEAGVILRAGEINSWTRPTLKLGASARPVLPRSQYPNRHPIPLLPPNPFPTQFYTVFSVFLGFRLAQSFGFTFFHLLIVKTLCSKFTRFTNFCEVNLQRLKWSIKWGIPLPVLLCSYNLNCMKNPTDELCHEFFL